MPSVRLCPGPIGPPPFITDCRLTFTIAVPAMAAISTGCRSQGETCRQSVTKGFWSLTKAAICSGSVRRYPAVSAYITRFTPPRKAVDRRGMAVQIIGELSHGQNFRSAVVVVGFHGCPSAPLRSVHQGSLPVAYYLYGVRGLSKSYLFSNIIITFLY